jgi:hypothetical protein
MLMKTTETTERKLRDRIDELEEQLRQIKLVVMPRLLFPHEWLLNRSERHVVASLYAAPDGYRSKDMLSCCYVIFNGQIERKHEGLAARISHIRNKLRRYRIQILTRFAEGYELPKASREIIRVALEREVSPALSERTSSCKSIGCPGSPA